MSSSKPDDRSRLRVNVEITSDVACPWYEQSHFNPLLLLANLFLFIPRCWVGKRHLDLAIERLEKDFVFNIRWLPFSLNPYLTEEGMVFKDYVTMKFGEGALEKFTSKKMPFVETGNAVVRSLSSGGNGIT